MFVNKREKVMQKMPLRIVLQQFIYKVINPVVKLLIRAGLTPNVVTTVGFILNILVTVIFIWGGEEGNRGDLSYVGWAGALILFAGLFDMLDGQVARLGKMGSAFGALYDSVLDRYSEMVLFFGICYYLVAHHYFLSSIFAFIALIGSMMVSYTRARAEGLGVECKEGLMQRPERVVTIGITALACGITGHYIGGNARLFVRGIPFHVLETMSIFTIPITVMAILTNVTAVKRLLDARNAILKREESEKSRSTASKTLVSVVVIAATMALSAAVPPGIIKYSFTEPQDTFPVPKGITNQLFYLQRTHNTNTIICELNLDNRGQLNEDNPVHVYWIRYPEGGIKKELSYIQRVFAYGMKYNKLNNGSYRLHFVCYSKQQFHLMKYQGDNKYHVFATIRQKEAILTRIFVKTDESGTFWKPHVIYFELKGIDPVTGKELMERLAV
jgi:phosphatidylglycerophosphate synthase